MSGPKTSWIWRGCLIVLGVTISLSLAWPTPAGADPIDKAIAEIEHALETNPAGVSPEKLDSCRAMLNTARLLHKMGRNARAIRRIQSCRELLELEGHQSRRATETHPACG